MLKDMSKKKMRGFTLIELVAVLVIMAILALIVTPLVMNIIRKARIAADKRSVDAYGRSIELAIASYLLDNGKFPTSVGELTIEYSGNKVACSTTQLNPDSSVYLAGCTVAGRTVDYAYGTDKSPSYTAYSVGDHISYNGVTYYVIENSDSKNNTVKLLKENPLTVKEINDLNIDGINVSGKDTAYGEVKYGSSANYETSTVKQVVDKWAEGAVKTGDSVSARLITKKDIEDNFEFEKYDCCGGCGGCIANRIKTSWMYGNYVYWTMTESSLSHVLTMQSNGNLSNENSMIGYHVRPVLEISKSADLTKLES